jgi:nitrate/nitrite transporter NarK
VNIEWGISVACNVWRSISSFRSDFRLPESLVMVTLALLISFVAWSRFSVLKVLDKGMI